MIPLQSYPWIYFETTAETHNYASPPYFLNKIFTWNLIPNLLPKRIIFGYWLGRIAIHPNGNFNNGIS